MAKPGRSEGEARDSLPPELRAAFDALVADYRAASEEHVGQRWASYVILAELVRRGWRKPDSRG